MNQRLIDANALKKKIEIANEKSCFDISEDLTSHDTVGFWEGFNYVSQLIDSAPTVETADDMLARLSKMPGSATISTPENFEESEEYVARYWPALGEVGTYRSPMNGFGKTPLEAVKKLEASLNQK